jgi:hypothetical protein
MIRALSRRSAESGVHRALLGIWRRKSRADFAAPDHAPEEPDYP